MYSIFDKMWFQVSEGEIGIEVWQARLKLWTQKCERYKLFEYCSI